MVGVHTVTVYTDPGQGGWSAPLASNPYMTTDAVGWQAGPFSAPLVWHPDGSVSTPSNIARDPAYPVARTAASLYRVRATFTVEKQTPVTWGVFYGFTPGDAWRGPFWAPAGDAAQQESWNVFRPGTYTVEASFDPSAIASRLVYVGPFLYTWGVEPAVSPRVSTLELTQRLAPGVDLSCLVDTVTINHGRDDSGSQPEASSATVNFTSTPADPLPIEVDVGASLLVSTTTDRGVSQRFVGRITDVSAGWDEAGEYTPDAGTGQLVAVGPLADLGRAVVGDVPWPAELDGARVGRALAAAGVTLDPFYSDPGTVTLLARDVDATAALDAAHDAATSASGVLWETRAGEIRYADANHRRGIPASLGLDACDVLVTPTWRRTIEGLVNSVSVGYGVTPEGGEAPRYVASNAASIARWGKYGYDVTTQLATLTDAQALGSLLLARNSSPVWVMATLPVDVPGLDPDQYAALLGLDLHALVYLTGLPAIGTAPTSANLWVEGYRETLSYGVHDFDLVVSGYCRTVPAPRWDDVNPAVLWGGNIPGTQRRNECVNPSFEVGLSYWTVVNATSTRDTTTAGHGAASLKATRTGSTTVSVNLNGSAALTPVAPGETVSFGWKYRTDSTAPSVSVIVHFRDAGGAILTQPSRTVPPSTSWTRHTFSAVAPANAAYYLPYLVYAAGAGTVGESWWVDEVIIEKAATAGTYFDGDTPDVEGSVDYGWTGEPGGSPSTATALTPIAGGLPPNLTWDEAACLGPPTNLGRWNDQPASLRWDAIPPAKTWNTYT